GTGRCGRRRLSRRDGDGTHDLVVFDQERELAIEQDLGTLASQPGRDRRRTQRGRESRRGLRVERSRARKPLPLLERQQRVRRLRPEPPVIVSLHEVAEVDELALELLRRLVGCGKPVLRREWNRNVRGLELLQGDRAGERHPRYEPERR